MRAFVLGSVPVGDFNGEYVVHYGFQLLCIVGILFSETTGLWTYHCQGRTIQCITSAADMHSGTEQRDLLAILSFVDRVDFFSILYTLALSNQPHA